MASFKLVFEFNENTGAGFNEVYYREASSIADAAAGLKPIVNARLTNLHFLSVLQQIRISSLDASRLTTIVPVVQAGSNPDGTGGGVIESTAAKPAPAGAAVVCLLKSTPSGRRYLWMRGVNEGDIERSAVTGRDIFHPNFAKGLDNQMKLMAKAGFGIRVIGKANPITNPLWRITKVDGSRGDGTADVTASGLVSLDGTRRMVISRASNKDLPALNGRWTVLAATGMVYTIAYRTPNNISVMNSNLGYVHAELYASVNPFDPANCSAHHIGTRTTRNPLTHSRGARRPRRLRLSD